MLDAVASAGSDVDDDGAPIAQDGHAPGATFRDGTKGAALVDLLRDAPGASLPELMAASGWQAHSVRGFLSGALRKKHGLAVARETGEDGIRLPSCDVSPTVTSPAVNISRPAANGSSRRSASANDPAAAITALGQRSYAELQMEWRRLTRTNPPKKVGRDLLELAIASALQEKAFGGLSASARRQLDAVALSLSSGGDIVAPRVTAIKPGARLVREWNGTTHDVLVLADGFRWRGQRWASLSAIAREITGTRWSGPRFFGLTTRAAEPTIVSRRGRRAVSMPAIAPDA